jgi:hypothetical protein
MKHKHCDVIKAWADGAEIEFKDIFGKWRWIENPEWNGCSEYRIKREPKPDLFIFLDVRHHKYINYVSDDEVSTANLKLILDGDTGKLKSAEVLK